MKYAGWKITTGFLNGNLLNGMEVEGIDEEASIDRYAELFREELEREFPGAEITIRRQNGSGSEPSTHNTRAFAPDDPAGTRHHREESAVDSIAGHLFGNLTRWIVEEGA